jgi:large subunit ribosomal protein L35
MDMAGTVGWKWGGFLGRTGFALPRLRYPAVSMPKMKTHSGAKKRFRKTAKGKLLGRHAFSSHILEKKSPKRKRHFRDPVEISKADRDRVTKLLGSAGR